MSNMSGFLVPIGEQESNNEDAAFRPAEYPGTRIAYNNLIGYGSSWRFSSDGDPANELDLDYLGDYTNTTRYSAGRAGDLTITSEAGSPDIYDYFDNVCIAGVPWFDDGITAVTLRIETFNDLNLESTGTKVIVIDSSNFDDNKPLMVSFERVYSNRIEVEFTATGTVSIAMLHASFSLQLPYLPDEGFDNSQWNITANVTNLVTSTNKIGPATAISAGTSESYSFSNISEDYMNKEFAEFLVFVKAFVQYPVFAQWDPVDSPNDVILGRIDIRGSSYSSGKYSNISISVAGIV